MEKVMTEEEAKKALFKVHFDYMMLPKEKRNEEYPKYIEKRRKIKKALAKTLMEKKESETKTK